MPPTKCTATTAKRQPCKAWAQPGTDPPLCAAHNPATPTGAPRGNRNVQTHGAYTQPDPEPATISEIIAASPPSSAPSSGHKPAVSRA